MFLFYSFLADEHGIRMLQSATTVGFYILLIYYSHTKMAILVYQ